MVTVDPMKGLAPAQCNFSGAGSADPSTEYAGFCGVAPAGTSSQGVLNNVTAAVPVWLCPPTGYVRAPVGGEWAGGQVRGQGLTLEQCAAACDATVDCRAFAVSDASGCKLWSGKELSGFVPATDTSAFLRKKSTSAPCLPRQSAQPTNVSFVYVSRDHNLCSNGATPVHTHYTGVVCNRREAAR